MHENADSLSAQTRPQTPVWVVQQQRSWKSWLLMSALGISVLANLALFGAFSDYMSNTRPPHERFHSGELTSRDRIARITADFTIMPPFTSRIIDVIKHVEQDDNVKGVLLVINSPGGLVSDSHEIYHRLKQLSTKKPIFVSMKGLAASGGYYIAMGAGAGAPIYAEPTTWTGSIGVIMPRYNASELASKIGVESEPLTTGPLKDTLNPLKELNPREKEVWETILDESFTRFLSVIDEGRTNLDLAQIREIATGQVYTADQALAKGLIDNIGFEEDALAALQQKLGLSKVRVVTYEHPRTLAESLLGASAQSPQPATDPLSRLLDASVPRAMYMFGWQAAQFAKP